MTAGLLRAGVTGEGEVSLLIWVLGTEFGSLGRTVIIFNCWASSLDLKLFI